MFFENVPTFDSFSPAQREYAILRYKIFEDLLRRTPDSVLHTSVQPPHETGIPTKQLAHLIAKFCKKHRLSHENLLDSISQAGGEVQSTALVSERGDKRVVNLLVLQSDVLWVLYASLPSFWKPTTSKSKQKRRLGVVKQLKKTEKPTKWVSCDFCKKWRRVLGDIPEKWNCSDRGDGIDCQTVEDSMANDEQWNGETRGGEHSSDEFDADDAEVEEFDLFGEE